MGSPVNLISSNPRSNLIINGGMRFDQRREGAVFSTIGGSNSTYVCDRWRQDRDISATTVTSRSSAAPPAGFTHFQRLSVTTGASVTASQFSEWIQQIESTNTVDLKFGTAQAESLGLSFWIRSSIAGPSSGVIRNASRSYVFSFNIDVANTWEYKTITIPGDTSGTWIIGDPGAAGLVLGFCQSAGTTYRTTAGSWQTGIFVGATGGNNITAVTGATYDLTGVQLKIGAPREFEHRNFAQELALCHRYCEVMRPSPGAGIASGLFANTGVGSAIIHYQVKRVNPAISVTNATSFRMNNASNNFRVVSVNSAFSSLNSAVLSFNATSLPANAPFNLDVDNANGVGVITFDAEF